MQTAQTHAMTFLQAGIGVFPIQRRDKRPEFSLLPIDPMDKKPTWEPYKTNLPSERQVSQWFDRGLENYAVISGWKNLVVLDFDDAQEYAKWTLWIMDNQSARWVYEQAYKVRTARGVHVYIRTQNIERARKIGKIDIKAAGGYVLGPGSIHPSGITYTPINTQLFFPLIGSLSEILPAELLQQDTTVNKPKTTKATQTTPLDPWMRASNPSNPGNNDLIRQIRDKVKVQDFFLDLTSTGDHHFVTACPFHQDKHPSFWVDTKLQICGCFAGCNNKPMDVINLYARLFSMSNTEAIFALSNGLQ